jgi:hypothetical protein
MVAVVASYVRNGLFTDCQKSIWWSWNFELELNVALLTCQFLSRFLPQFPRLSPGHGRFRPYEGHLFAASFPRNVVQHR